MSKISILPEVIANKIAAGEVVQNPASIVKELVENSIDAHASNINIVIENGGIDLLIVEDDGDGMTAKDAVLCLSRHATSKLKTIEDLQNISSYGFRGEALSSIAAVAKMRLITKTDIDAVATEVVIEGGKIIHIGECASKKGTRIEIRDLFYNVPARRKFLKSTRAEAALVEEFIKVHALANYSVAFRFKSQNKQILNLAPCDKLSDLSDSQRIQRVIDCMGQKIAEFIYPFVAKTEYLNISGYLIAPLQSRRDSKGIKLFINNRPIFDKNMNQIIKVAYRTLLEVGRQPICVLNIDIDPQIIDVNVHPQKLEVRFSNQQLLQSILIKEISNFLSTTPWLKSTQFLSEQPAIEHNAEQNYTPKPIAHRVEKQQIHQAIKDFHANHLQASLPPQNNAKTSSVSNLKQNSTQPGFGFSNSFSDLKVVGQLNRTFLVLEGEGGMVMIDQHAAHERVVFEQLRKQIKNNIKNGQKLLFPITLDIDAQQRAAVEEHSDKLAMIGIEISLLGDNQAALKSIPSLCSNSLAQQIAGDALAELAHCHRADNLDDWYDQLCARIACHSSVRKGQKLSESEIYNLLKSLDQIDLGAHCPHGRPVVRNISFGQMAKWFHRH